MPQGCNNECFTINKASKRTLHGFKLCYCDATALRVKLAYHRIFVVLRFFPYSVALPVSLIKPFVKGSRTITFPPCACMYECKRNFLHYFIEKNRLYKTKVIGSVLIVSTIVILTV